MVNPSQGTGGTRDHTSLLNRNVVGQHSSESAGVLSPSSINPNDIGKNWTDLGVISPSGFPITSLSYLGNGIEIFMTIGTPAHILRSSDYGLTWTDLGTFGTFGMESSVYLGNGIALVVTSNGSVIRSTDFGVSWTVQGTVTGGFVATGLSYLGNGIVIFASLDGVNSHIFRSTNYGASGSWVNLGVLPSSSGPQATIYLENGITLFSDSAGNIYRSTNFGLAWVNEGVIDINVAFSFSYFGNGVVIFGTTNGHIFRSTDFGLTWVDIGLVSTSAIWNITYAGNGIVVFSDQVGHIFRSIDYGLTWSDLGAISGTVSRVISYLYNGVVLFGDDNGHIFRSDVSYKIDETKATVHNDLLNRNLAGVSVHNSESVGVLSPSSINPNDIGKDWVLTTVYVINIDAIEYLGSGIVLASTGFVAGNPHILRSTDHGRVFFDSITIPTGVSINNISYFGNGIVVFGTTNGHIWRSTDFGLSFSDVGAISAFTINRIKYLGHGYAIALDGSGFVQRSINFGATWPLAIGVTGNALVTTSYLDNGIAIIGDNNGHIWRSTTISTGFPSFSDRGDVTGTNTTLLTSSYLGNGVIIVGTGNGHIIRSTDYGLNWTDLGLISASFFSTSEYLGNGVVICGAFNGHIWRSTDYGLNWTDIIDITTSTLLADTLKYIGNGAIVVGDSAGNIFRSDISYKLDESIQDIEKPIRTILASETLAKGDETLLVDATAGDITIFLPSITVAPGHVFNFVRVDATANTVTIDGAGAQTINLALTQPLNVQFMALSMKAKPFAPNAGWWIV